MKTRLPTIVFDTDPDEDNIVSVIDKNIHTRVRLDQNKKRGIGKEEFLARVANLPAIRSTRSNDIISMLSFYPCSESDLRLFQYFSEICKYSNFAELNEYLGLKIALIQIPSKVFSWMRETPLDILYMQIACWIASEYTFLEEGERSIMNDQLEAQFSSLVLKIHKEHFIPKYKSDHQERLGRERLEDYEKMQDIYFAAAKSYYGSIPPEHLRTPDGAWMPHIEPGLTWGFTHVCNRPMISWSYSYFTDTDWEEIILKNEPLNYLPSEACGVAAKKHWETFLRLYKLRDEGLSEQSAVDGSIYIIQQGADNIFKIGYTQSDPKSRLKALQTGNPSKLSLMGHFPCTGRQTELAIFDYFSEYRLEGEWFRLLPDDVEKILDERWRSDNFLV